MNRKRYKENKKRAKKELQSIPKFVLKKYCFFQNLRVTKLLQYQSKIFDQISSAQSCSNIFISSRSFRKNAKIQNFDFFFILKFKVSRKKFFEMTEE
ncbi:hypothetical protein BpHYR1_004687 [Brachionus plicatilis]|uniref:Uncharacterized protein n=1 Tax=Brachionus plicatilis TaxID=10195 RepID=A0A3M7R3V7_BRAPC|nr:hypothetical protein BpHYR1_004687 [Brachionus plicatilis]